MKNGRHKIDKKCFIIIASISAALSCISILDYPMMFTSFVVNGPAIRIIQIST